uniref:Uncharacterized protein n=1 Tax=Timema douglasi TaxID=61478 RepID=A0A7R8ZB88_TIMDO|nr:unnamed protein product [Timema douglasi]
MAQWGNELEILSDLDKLSVFTTGQLTKDTLIRRGNKIVTSTSFGRGTVNKRPGKEPKIGNHFHPSSQSSSASSYSSDLEDLALENEMAFGLTAPPPFSLGRSRLMSYEASHEDNKIARREAALQIQLRMACGKGYSNELIERYLMQHQVSSDKEEQFADCHGSGSASSISNGTSPVKSSPHQSPPPCVPKPAKDLPWERCQVEKQILDPVYTTPSPEPDPEVTDVSQPSPPKKQSSGSNETTSALLDTLKTTGFSIDGIEYIRLGSDGCPGRNKNSTVIGVVRQSLFLRKSSLDLKEEQAESYRRVNTTSAREL